MRKRLLLLGFLVALIGDVSAQVYSDQIYFSTSCAPNTTCTGYVANPAHAADSNQTNYATMYNGLGVGSSVTLEFGFSTPAQGGSLVGVTLQKGNQLLSAGLLSNITVQLLNSSGTVVAQRNGLQLEDLGLLGGFGSSPAYAVSFYTPQGAYDIQRVRVTLGGVLNVLNDIRVYNAFYLSPSTNGSGQICGLRYATGLENSSCSGLLCSVVNPAFAADTSNYDDYALLNIPVGLIGVLGTAEIELSWEATQDSGQYVGFIIGQNNTLLNLALLGAMDVTLYDSLGNTVYNKAGFSTVDLSLLSGSSQKSIIGFYSPVDFYSARIRLTQLVGLLTSLRVYGAITFNATPDVVDITTSPFTNLCQGDSVILTAESGFSQYYWSTGETTQSIVVDQSGTYTLTALDADACLYYSQVQPITINPLPQQPVIANITVNPTVLCNGSSVVVSSISLYAPTWSTGQSTPSITISNAGNYYLTVTDSLGCMSTSDTLTIITDSANVSIISMDSTTCEGTIITLIADGGPLDVMWNNGFTGDTLQATPNMSMLYIATVTSPNGCTDSASVNVQVNPLPPQPTINPLALDSIVLCNGAQQTLTANIPAGPYLISWSDGTSGNSIDVGMAGDYYVTIADSVGCVRTSDTVTVQTETAMIDINTASGDTATCYSATHEIELIATANGSILWSTNDTTSTLLVMPNITTTYSATVTTPLGCTASDNFTLTVNQPPIPPTINGVTPPGADSLIICNGTSATLSVNAAAGDDILWSNGQSTENITINTGGNYYVTVEDDNGCTATSDTVAVVTDIAQINLVSADSASCAGENIVIVVSANGMVEWQDGATGLAYQNTPMSTTTYTATVTTVLGCENQLSVTVNVDNAIAYANAENDSLFIIENTTSSGMDVAWNDSITATADWLILNGPFNGQVNINGSWVTYTPEEDYEGQDSIIYVICSTNACGTACDTAMIYIKIETDGNPNPNNDDDVRIPGGLSPNGDGTNDNWVIDGLDKFPNNKIAVLNRWGDILYKAEPYQNNWNGTASSGLVINNEPLPDGTYYYVLDLGDGSKPIRGFIEIRK